jgi:multiple sugar transport system ATP-binding protein
MNLLLAPVSGGKAKMGDLNIDVPASAGSSVIVGIRPEGWAPAASGFHVLVEVVEELGSDAFVYGKPADTGVQFANAVDEGAQVIVRWDPKNPPKPGQTVTVANLAHSVHLFDATTGLRLN